MAKLTLGKITISNFKSFGQKPQEFDLSEKTSRLIVGDNRDIGESGKSKNGVGKSTILDAVVYGLYGKGVERGLKADEFINLTNGKRLSIKLEFSLGDSKFVVERTRKPNAVKFMQTYPVEENLTLDSMANTDKLITDTIGYGYEVFVMLFFLSPSKKSFMSMDAAEQRGIVESILSLDVLAKRAETLTKVIAKDLKADIQLLERDLQHETSLFDEKSAQKVMYETESKKFAEKQQQELVRLNQVLREYDIFDFNEIQQAMDLRNEKQADVSSLMSQMNHINDIVSKIEQDLAVENKLKSQTEVAITENKNKLSGYEGELAAEKSSRSELLEMVENIDELIADVKARDAVIADIEKHQHILSGLMDRRKSITQRIASANKAQASYDEFEKEKVEKIAHLEELISGLPSMDMIEAELQLNADIKIRQEEILKLTQEINDLEKMIKHTESEIFTNQEILDDLLSGKCPTCGGAHIDESKTVQYETKISDLYESISDANLLISEISNKIKDLESKGPLEVSITDAELYEAKSSLLGTETSLSNAKNTANPYQGMISDCDVNEQQNSLDNVNREIKTTEGILSVMENNLTELLKTCESFTIGDLNDIKEAANSIDNVISGIQSNILRVKEENKKQEESLAVREENISSLSAKKSSHIEEKNNFFNQISDVNSEIEILNGKCCGLRDESDIDAKKSVIESIRESIAEKQNEENIYLSLIENIVLPDVDGTKEKISQKNKELTHTQYLGRLLTDNKSFIRKNIVDQYLSFLNSKLIKYTMDLGLPHIAQLNNDMSVEIVYMNKSVSYYNMSAGERLRLNAATTAAFKDLIGVLGKGCNLLMVDEFVDGSLDPAGMYKSFDFLQSNTDSLLLVSHRNEFTTKVDSVVTMVKQNGFTTIQ